MKEISEGIREVAMKQGAPPGEACDGCERDRGPFVDPPMKRGSLRNRRATRWASLGRSLSRWRLGRSSSEQALDLHAICTGGPIDKDKDHRRAASGPRVLRIHL